MAGAPQSGAFIAERAGGPAAACYWLRVQRPGGRGGFLLAVSGVGVWPRGWRAGLSAKWAGLTREGAWPGGDFPFLIGVYRGHRGSIRDYGEIWGGHIGLWGVHRGLWEVYRAL